MHKIIDANSILTTVSSDNNYDVIIASGAWGDHFMTHFFNSIQRNHKLCRDRVEQRYEYVFYTTTADYEKHKAKFVDDDITFLLTDTPRHPGGMNGVQIDYAYKRQLPLILMASDCLHTTNLIPNLLTKFSDRDAVCVMSQRMYIQLMDDIKDCYDTVFDNPREFLKKCLPHLHVRERRYFMDSYRRTGTYGSMMYPVRRDGVLIGELIRSFHLGVISIRKPVTGLRSGFLDSNPFLNRLSSPDKIGMVTDSDDGFCVDVNFDPRCEDDVTTPLLTDMSQITRCWKGWRGNAVTAVNESLMGFNIAIHVEPLDQSWTELAKKADDNVTHFYGGTIKNKPIDWNYA